MKDFYSVHEFSVLSGIEASTLRYWDEIGIFSPIKRNPDNNYRYYSLVQLLALNFVDTLSKLGIPLKTIGELRENRDPETFISVLEKRERELDVELRRIRECSSIIHARQELIKNGLKVTDENEISIIEFKEDKIFALWPRNEYQEGGNFIEPLTAFIGHAGEYHVNLAFPVGGYFDNIESFAKAPDRPDHFTSMDITGLHVRKAGRYLCGYARGYYGIANDLPERMIAYAKEHSLKLTQPLYAQYLHEETCVQEPTHYLGQYYTAV